VPDTDALAAVGAARVVVLAIDTPVPMEVK